VALAQNQKRAQWLLFLFEKNQRAQWLFLKGSTTYQDCAHELGESSEIRYTFHPTPYTLLYQDISRLCPRTGGELGGHDLGSEEMTVEIA
jgi:hypothetical protein